MLREKLDTDINSLRGRSRVTIRRATRERKIAKLQDLMDGLEKMDTTIKTIGNALSTPISS